MSYFENVTPESIDIKSAGILSFLGALKDKGIELHSLKVIRHGKCCASAWYAPYGPEDLHPIYSYSKSFTSTAIGFAWQEGILRLDEKIVDLFPEECPELVSDNLKEVTIHHLLTMGSGQETQIEMADGKEDWIRDFMHHPFLHKPGSFFYYNTPGTNMLSAIITKKTGLSLMDYLRPRLFEPLGIDPVSCYVMKDKNHTCHGGGGMKLTTESMARFAYFMLHKGEWEGKKLLNGWYERMGSKQIETAGDSEGHVKEWANGYGYQCWMCSLPGSFRADGAFGQFGFVFPSLDLIVVTTAACEQTQTLIDCMYEHLISAVCPDGALKDQAEYDLTDILGDLSLPSLLNCRNPEIEAKLEGVHFYSAEAEEDPDCMSSFEKLVGGSGLFEVKEDSAVTDQTFTFTENELIWTIQDGGEEKVIHAALDGSFTKNEIGGHTYAACAAWRAVRAIEMEIRRIDAISGVCLLFRFQGDELSMEADDTLMTVGGLGMHEKKLVKFYSTIEI